MINTNNDSCMKESAMPYLFAICMGFLDYR